MADRALATANEELEAVILEDPLDPSGWLVYGDWLQAEGDPRGELVAVQAKLARDPGNPELMEAQRELFRTHGDGLLEGLHRWLVPTADRGPLFRLSWEFGFLWTANVAPSGHHLPELIAGLRALLTHPSARFLHALTIATPPADGWPSVLEVLHQLEGVRPLRILFLGDSAMSAGHPRPAFGPIGDLSGLWSRFPRLEIVALRGGMMDLGGLELPRLRELTIETSALQREALLALGARTWPALERLELWFGDRRCTCTLNELVPILEAARFPALGHLGIRNCPFVDRVCHALAHAPLAAQLRVLDLSLGTLTDLGAAALMDAKESFTNLAVLDVRWSHFRSEWSFEGLAKFVDRGHVVSDRDDLGRPKVWLDT
ncbi:MAG: TIGR02996 domain-containing protein [Labilithrix sp.]